MNLLKSVSYRASVKDAKEVLRRVQSTLSTSSSHCDIKIPNRIERGPTDILKALEKTISKDPTAPAYKFIDDPYLIPQTKETIRLFGLSRESGRKTARWIINENPSIFKQKLADPPIPALEPPTIYDDKNVSENILLTTIVEGDVSKALTIYKLLNENVSTKTKQSLFELLCFFNTTKPISTDVLEEKWYMTQKKQNKNTWTETEDLIKLFEFLKTQDEITVAAAYNAYICGLSKYFNANKTWSIYTYCKENNIPLNVNAYNGVLSLIPVLRNNSSQCKILIWNILKEMSNNGIYPNIHTLNATFNTISFFPSYSAALDFAGELFNEFSYLDIKPTLTSFYCILCSFNLQIDDVRSVISKLLDTLEGETLVLQDPKDTYFFPLIMNIAYKIGDRSIGERIHKILSYENNYLFLNNYYKHNVYYQTYLLLILSTESLDTFFEYYYRIVPHVYILEPFVAAEIIKSLKLHCGEINQMNLPKFWSHLMLANLVEKDAIVPDTINLMCNNCNLMPESPLHVVFAEAAWTLWNFIMQRRQKNLQQIQWKASYLGDIAILSLRAKYFERVHDIIFFMVHNEELVHGILTLQQINELYDTCILEEDSSIALLLLQYAVKNGYKEIKPMTTKIYKSLSLTEKEKSILIDLVGEHKIQ